MRIISGIARGRRLKEPTGMDIRPTSDMVKESIFNIVQFDIEGRRVLDLFAGTGQLGIEALSRGADSVVFIDNRTESIKLVRENLKLCGLSSSAEFYTRDALSYIRESGKFDLIFLDPPYDTVLAEESLNKIIEFDKLNNNGIIICETRAAKIMPEVLPNLKFKEYRYGGVKISRYERQ